LRERSAFNFFPCFRVSEGTIVWSSSLFVVEFPFEPGAVKLSPSDCSLSRLPMAPEVVSFFPLFSYLTVVVRDTTGYPSFSFLDPPSALIFSRDDTGDKRAILTLHHHDGLAQPLSSLIDSHEVLLLFPPRRKILARTLSSFPSFLSLDNVGEGV